MQHCCRAARALQGAWPPPGVVRLGPGAQPRLLSRVDLKYTELDLHDDARGWSFATTTNSQLVQVLCTVMTPRLRQTEQERDQAVNGAAVEFSAILAHLRIR